MKCTLRIAIVLAVALYATLADAAAATWTKRGKIATCATGTCDTPTATDGTQGMDTTNTPRFAIQVCADSGQTITAGTTGTVDIYVLNPVTNLWGIWRQYKVQTVTGSNKRCGWAVDDSPGFGIPDLVPYPGAFIAAVPNAIAVSSGGTTIAIMALNAAGQPN